MDEEIERLLVSVRADTGAFARDVAAMRAELDGPLAAGLERAGRVLETALMRAVRTGKLGFEDLKRVALVGDGGDRRGGDPRRPRRACRAAAAGGGTARGGWRSCSRRLLGAPGRATGGPVAPGRAYLVGERGPELFVPTASGRVETGRRPACARSG